MKRTIIIAEAGVNHNGDINLAKRLVEIAADAGADYVKFQTFITENLVSDKAEKASYQSENMGSGGSQFEMLKKLELSKDNHLVLIAHCKKHAIKFLSTAFDLNSIELLSELGID
ncbi:MAG: N-acetylneuraminate synthase family protein, partial [Flavobacteriales bacterium]